MKPRKPPTTKHDLFPDTWVIGTAAAALAKDDEGVLLADDWDLGLGSAEELQPCAVTPLSAVAPLETRRPIEEELAELRAENERLRRCIAGSRGDLEAVNWQWDEGLADPETGLFIDPQLHRHDQTRRRRRPAEALARFALIGAVMALAVGTVAAIWLAGQRLASLDGPMAERVHTLRTDIVGAVGGLGQRAVAWVRPVAGNPGHDPGATTGSTHQ